MKILNNMFWLLLVTMSWMMYRIAALTISNIKKYDHVICSLGRLDKKYIPTVIKGFEKFAQNTKDRIFIHIHRRPT